MAPRGRSASAQAVAGSAVLAQGPGAGLAEQWRPLPPTPLRSLREQSPGHPLTTLSLLCFRPQPDFGTDYS